MQQKEIPERVPIQLEPVPVERVWGGRAVERLLGWSAPEGKVIGEWWTLSFRHDFPSLIKDGPFKGIPLPQLLAAHPELLGEDPSLGLLIKIIDSAERLSVQVHPDDRLATCMGLDSGKTECWYFLESRPGACIYCGLKEGVDPEILFQRAARNPEPKAMEEVLEAVPVREGGLAFISAGTVHAIGEGVVLLEVQQNSDTTFRIYDWGRPRTVHLEEARRAVKEAKPEGAVIRNGSKDGVLVRCDKFVLIQKDFEGQGSLPSTGPGFAALSPLTGKGVITCGDYQSRFKKGDTYFLPAGCPGLDLKGPGRFRVLLSHQGGADQFLKGR
jgi:mannose-6-phosphate isomerase